MFGLGADNGEMPDTTLLLTMKVSRFCAKEAAHQRNRIKVFMLFYGAIHCATKLLSVGLISLRPLLLIDTFP